MKKQITVFVDDENAVTYNGFDYEEATNDELFMAILHLSCILYDRGIDMQEIYTDMLESLGSAELIYDEEENDAPIGSLLN